MSHPFRKNSFKSEGESNFSLRRKKILKKLVTEKEEYSVTGIAMSVLTISLLFGILLHPVIGVFILFEMLIVWLISVFFDVF